MTVGCGVGDGVSMAVDVGSGVTRATASVGVGGGVVVRSVLHPPLQNPIKSKDKTSSGFVANFLMAKPP